MNDKILISKDNLKDISKSFIDNLLLKIRNKDISTSYLEQLKKSGLIKIDGLGDMFLCNNGEYINIDLENVNKDKNMINTIYKLFKIQQHEEGNWKILKNKIPTKKYSMTSQIYNKKIYTIGGYYDNDCGNKVEIYDIESDTWNIGKSMPTARMNLCSSLYNNNIYCIGGYVSYGNNNRYTDILEIYDIETDTWSVATRAVYGRHALSSCIHNDKIYVIGGCSQDELSYFQIYDITTDTWTNPIRMPFKTSYISCEIYNSKIYCIYKSQYEGINKIQIYDIESNTWSEGNSNGISRKEQFSTLIYFDKIYCIGGDPSYGFGLKNVDIYNISKNICYPDKSLNIERRGCISEIYKNKIYCIGGLKDECEYSEVLQLPYIDYTIKLPQEIDNKLNIIKYDGKGDKVLSNNGSYIIPNNNYNIMNEDDIKNILDYCFPNKEV